MSRITQRWLRPLGVCVLLVMMLAFALMLAGPGSAQAQSDGRGGGPISVLLVGNSHLLMPGFINRVRARLEAESGQPPRIETLAEIGTTLTKSRRKAGTLTALKSRQWDVVVLQESTTAFMTGHGRGNYMAAVQWFRDQKPAEAKLLLWETWPQGASHALYHGRGVWGKWFKNPPRSPDQLFSWIKTGTQKAAGANGAFIAPIGRCWMARAPGSRPYAGDDYHPSNAGLTFIAEILARSVVAAARDGKGGGGAIGSCG